MSAGRRSQHCEHVQRCVGVLRKRCDARASLLGAVLQDLMKLRVLREQNGKTRGT